MKLAEISIKRPSLVIVLFTILILGGLFSYSQLGYELIPFEQNVHGQYPGASPSEVKYGNEKKTEENIKTFARDEYLGFTTKHKNR
jgi:HAE1 family hydrophobic/amphiphilic exporter-1